ncbi:hypothetical protein Skr01_26460 [Sphaerisporangium krabiense]|nr:hypothetical protein Skr01_26460 [Sphaerisporangium krabiense]
MATPQADLRGAFLSYVVPYHHARARPRALTVTARFLSRCGQIRPVPRHRHGKDLPNVPRAPAISLRDAALGLCS